MKGFCPAPSSCQWHVVFLTRPKFNSKICANALGMRRRRCPPVTAASFEDPLGSSPKSEPPPSTEASSQNDADSTRPFASWAEEAVSGTEQDDWSRGEGLLGAPVKRTLGNVLFVAAIGGIAIAAFVLQRQYSKFDLMYIPIIYLPGKVITWYNFWYPSFFLGQYNKSIAQQPPGGNRGTSFSATTITPSGSSLDSTKSAGSEMPESSKEDEWRSGDEGWEFNSWESNPDHQHHRFLQNEGSQVRESVVPEINNGKGKRAHVFEEEPVHSNDNSVPTTTTKYPLRSPQGEAALQRMRAIQKSRAENLKKEHPRQVDEGANQAGEETSPEEMDYKSAFDMKYVDGWETSQKLANPEPEAVDEDTNSLDSLQNRADSTRKLAVRAMKAARQAALSSALSAEASEKASEAANQAIISAAKCQAALQLRAEDLIEETYSVAKGAEEAALQASREAAVGSAKAEIHRLDAERAAGMAVASADMSRPHGMLETVRAAWRSGRRTLHHLIQRLTVTMHSFTISMAENIKLGINVSRNWVKIAIGRIHDGLKSLSGKNAS